MVYNLIHTVFVMQLPWHWECPGDGGCAGGRERSQREGPVVAEGGGVDLAQRLLLPLPTHQLWIQDPPWKACPGLPAGTGILSAAQHADCPLTSQDAGLLLGAWKIGYMQWRTTAREADDCVQMYFPFHQHSSQAPGSWERKSRLCSPLISTCHCSAETSRKGFWMPNLDNEHQMLMFIFKYWHTTYLLLNTRCGGLGFIVNAQGTKNKNEKENKETGQWNLPGLCSASVRNIWGHLDTVAGLKLCLDSRSLETHMGASPLLHPDGESQDD